MRIRTLDLLKIAVTLVASATLIALMIPVAAGAAGDLVTLVDSDSNSQAQVDAGKLRIGDGSGKLSIDGTVLVRETMKGRTVHTASCSDIAGDGDSAAGCQVAAAPAGTTMIVTSIAVLVSLSSAQTLYPPQLYYGGIELVPTSSTSAVAGATRSVKYGYVGEFPVPSGAQPGALVNRSATGGPMLLNVHVLGYLVDNV